jgi:hypothetical protein
MKSFYGKIKKIIGCLVIFSFLLIPALAADENIAATVSLDVNSGSWTDPSMNDSQVTFSFEDKPHLKLSEYSNEVSNDGYILIGWSTEKEGGGYFFAPSDTISYYDDEVTDGMTLYAQWHQFDGTSYVAFVTGNVGAYTDLESENKVIVFDTSVERTVTIPSAEHEAYSLISWTEENTFISDPLIPGESIEVTENSVFLGRWIYNASMTHAFVFDSNADDVSGPKFQTTETRKTLSLEYYSDIERRGYVLTGWNDKEDGSGKHYDVYEEVDIEAEFMGQPVIRLYAEWEQIELPEEYYVFVLPDDVFNDGSTYKVVDRTGVIEIPVPERDPELFLLWRSTVSSGSGDQEILLPGESVFLNENSYFYPVWSNPERSYSWVFITANGGVFDRYTSGIMKENPLYWYQEFDSEDDYQQNSLNFINEIAECVSYENHTLVGWNTKPDGTGEAYSLGEFVPCDGLKTILYAQWTENSDTGEDNTGGGNTGGGNTGGGSTGGGNTGGGSTGGGNTGGSIDDGSSSDECRTFKDVHDVMHWSVEYVDFVVSHGLFTGMDENIFAPDANLTRAMVMTVLASYNGIETSGGNIWYEKGMEWAVASGISDGTFPDRNITREQLAMMLWRDAGSPTVSHALNFTDSNEISDWAQTAMQWAVSNGIMTGKSNGFLDPKGFATRAEAAVMFKNYTAPLAK